jgi:hypothetical protein
VDEILVRQLICPSLDGAPSDLQEVGAIRQFQRVSPILLHDQVGIALLSNAKAVMIQRRRLDLLFIPVLPGRCRILFEAATQTAVISP